MLKNSPAVSVIMPVYNSATTVARSLDSFISQTFADWELIAVNDGSTDASLEVLKRYASRDSRIIVLDKANGGVASARQAGMDKVAGTYFIHADSDDWVEPDMLEGMLGMAKRESADIVIADYFVECRNGKVERIRQKPGSLEAGDVLYSIYAKDIFGGLCHKLILKSVYDNAHASFIDGVDYCEDVLLLTQILRGSCLKISYLEKAYYHYILADNSLTRNISPRSFRSLEKFTNIFPAMIPNEKRYDSIIEKSRLDLFVAGFMNNIYDKNTQRLEFEKIRNLAYATPSVRWKAGFYCIESGWSWMAHKLIRF